MLRWVGFAVFAAGCAARSAVAPESMTSTSAVGGLSVELVENTCGYDSGAMSELAKVMVREVWAVGTRQGVTVFATSMPGDSDSQCPIMTGYRVMADVADDGFSAVAEIAPFDCNGTQLCVMSYSVTGK